MDSTYTLLLERTRVPQPTLQKQAVISIFEKLRSSPPHLNPDSNPGRHVITQCLSSASPYVIDQSVRELCRLVNLSVLSTSRALIELQSALEGCDPPFVDLFVKAIGFIVRTSFQEFDSENHPFVRVLACRSEVESELVQQVLLFIVQNKKLGFGKVLEFLKPFLYFSVLRIPFSGSDSSEFARQLVCSIASLSCSFASEAMPVFELLIQCLKYFPRKNANDFKDVYYIAQCLVDAYIVVLTQAVETGLEDKVESCGVELVETLLSFYTDLDSQFVGKEAIVELSKRLLMVQKQLGLKYLSEQSFILTSLFIILCRTEFEHEQLSILKLSIFLLKWENEIVYDMRRTARGLIQELLFLLPVINLLSSPSGSVKASAAELLSVLKKVIANLIIVRKEQPVIHDELPSISKFDSIICRLLQRLWFQRHPSFSSTYFLCLFSEGRTEVKELNSELRSWVFNLRKYSLLNVERQKSLFVSQRQEYTSAELPLLLGSLVSGLVMHHSLGSYAVSALAAIGGMGPMLGLPLLLCVLFYSKLLCNYDNDFHETLLDLMGMLPLVASQSAMLPLVVQTILPMLNKEAKPVLRATATRLLCKTWEVTDRVFGSLQGTLHPNGFSEFIHEKDVCVSMAASIRDVCSKNPDRGVDLILSVSACIESPDPTLRTLGFQSLGYLCEADVVDFYTAWSVIVKYAVDYAIDPSVAHGVAVLLRWGAMDAEAYSEASETILGILWEIGTSKNSRQGSEWVKAQCSAFESLTSFEVEHILRSIHDFETRNMQFIASEDNPDVLRAMERFEVKIITFQHNTRRRLLKEKRVSMNRVEKYLEVFPQIVFHSGNSSNNARDLPGAALLCVSFAPKQVHIQGTLKELPKVYAAFETALVDIAESLQLSRNIFVAILSLQSWKSFMQHWVKSIGVVFDSKVKASASDSTSKAAAGVLKILKKLAEESIPRSAENIVLALGALCMVLPPSSHSVTATASKFLLEWLFQLEHEHKQWSAAIALGGLSTCLHATEHKLRLDIIAGLLRVTCISKSTLVKGACGVGLGFCCQDLHKMVGTTGISISNKTSSSVMEVSLIGRIVRAISMLICQLSPSSSGSLRRLCDYLPMDNDYLVKDQAFDVSCDTVTVLEEDVWGIAGLIQGLGNSVGAIYRAGGQDAVIMLKTLLMSWIPHVNPVSLATSFSNAKPDMMLSIGSCLALPMVVDFCLRVELITDDELNHIVRGFIELISELIVVNKSGSFHQSFVMVSCVGAGSLLSYILEGGVRSMKMEDVKLLLELFRKTYTNQYPPTIYFGGMLGVVNALGAGAGISTTSNPKSSSLQVAHGQKDSSYIRGPILSAPFCEQLTLSLVQEMFESAQSAKDQQLRKYAAWAVSFLTYRWWSLEPHVLGNNALNDPSDKSVSQTFSEDSLVWKLCLWLAELNYVEEKIVVHVNTVASVLRCLSQAPRLPSFDWGAIIRRCMRYEDQVSNRLSLEHDYIQGALREECIMFALSHANHVNPLLHFLDEFSDLSRFRTVELNLQRCLLCHIAKFIKIFSGSRLEKLFDDMYEYFSSSSSPYHTYTQDKKSLLRASFWIGLYNCLEDASTVAVEYVTHIEKCMDKLFTILPTLHIDASSSLDQEEYTEEWSEAIRCIGKAPQSWVVDLLKIPETSSVQGSQLPEVIKGIRARVRLTMVASTPLTELGTLTTNILHSKSEDIWDVLLEVVSVLQHAEGNIKRKWLFDAVEISCITNYPSTALKFIGLLAGSCCKYMPFLVLDQVTVLSDLPVTLPSLLSERNWLVIAESVVLNLWISTERIFDWVKTLHTTSVSAFDAHSIDESENNGGLFLARVMHYTCTSLKDYLPFEKQLQLANMVVL